MIAARWLLVYVCIGVGIHKLHHYRFLQCMKKNLRFWEGKCHETESGEELFMVNIISLQCNTGLKVLPSNICPFKGVIGLGYDHGELCKYRHVDQATIEPLKQTNTVRPRDTRPRAARTSQVHVF